MGVTRMDNREARIRLELIPDALDAAIGHLEAMRQLPGNPLVMHTAKVIAHLRTVQDFARGDARVVPVEPESIRVGPPKLRRVK